MVPHLSPPMVASHLSQPVPKAEGVHLLGVLDVDECTGSEFTLILWEKMGEPFTNQNPTL